MTPHNPIDPARLALVLSDDLPDDLTEEEADFLAAADPDMAVITDYLANALSPEDRLAVERRLETDDAFAELAGPLLDYYRNMPRPWLEPMADDELHDGWNDVRRRMGLPPLGSAQPAAVVPAPETAVVIPELPLLRTLDHRLRTDGRFRRLVAGSSIAAVVLFAVALPLAFGLSSEWLHWQQTLYSQRVVLTGPVGGSTERLGDGSTADLASNTSLRWPLYYPQQLTRVLRLRGQATFEIVHHEGVVVRVEGGPTEVTVTGTRFRVTAYDDEEALVEVGAGVVEVRSTGVGGPPLVLRAGQRARVTRGAPPRLVPP